jgi:Transcriptional regulatory protein, C terminal
MNDRRNSGPQDVLSFGPFSLFAAERLLKKTDEPIPMGGRALDILIVLAQRAGEVVSHKELISSVWPDLTVEAANLRVHIAALRNAPAALVRCGAHATWNATGLGEGEPYSGRPAVTEEGKKILFGQTTARSMAG